MKFSNLIPLLSLSLLAGANIENAEPPPINPSGITVMADLKVLTTNSVTLFETVSHLDILDLLECYVCRSFQYLRPR